MAELQFLLALQIMDFRQLVSDPRPSIAVRIARLGLIGMSWPYWLAAQTKNWIYDRGWKRTYRSGLPTISVGNLSVGGTGKSPVVAWLAKRLRDDGLRVAILSRGYRQLDDGRNDEALELELLLPDVPHLQHWDRAQSAKVAEDELEMQCLLLDDAFQHRRMARDLDIVLLDSTDTPSAQRVLPAGLYREPFRNLRRAQVVLLTRADQVSSSSKQQLKDRVRRSNPQCLLLEAKHAARDLFVYPQRIESLENLRGTPILAFCAIGNPQAFFRSLEELGAQILDRKTWPDHHHFAPADIETLRSWPRQFPSAKWVVCTMKDSVKIQTPSLDGIPLGALRIELGLESAEEGKLLATLRSTIANHQPE